MLCLLFDVCHQVGRWAGAEQTTWSCTWTKPKDCCWLQEKQFCHTICTSKTAVQVVRSTKFPGDFVDITDDLTWFVNTISLDRKTAMFVLTTLEEENPPNPLFLTSFYRSTLESIWPATSLWGIVAAILQTGVCWELLSPPFQKLPHSVAFPEPETSRTTPLTLTLTTVFSPSRLWEAFLHHVWVQHVFSQVNKLLN